MYCRWPSANSVSKASELFPEPLSPMMTTKLVVRNFQVEILQVVGSRPTDADRLRRPARGSSSSGRQQRPFEQRQREPSALPEKRSELSERETLSALASSGKTVQATTAASRWQLTTESSTSNKDWP